ncbi:NADPH:quinone oxidoreductase-like [Gossypium raimondii]|uniref:NADPH:quinone oxidoreductase-like n=1 Tax=Gossypium raimondii TaxID=29730 RepID=UPI00227B7955|nr:NADPH:quinone oxidoreductase-like [Gossypium raimondii]
MEAIAAAKPVIKVAALCGSLRDGSYDEGLPCISPIPMLNTDLEVDGKYPPVVEAFRQRILVADSILFASPDYCIAVRFVAVIYPNCTSLALKAKPKESGCIKL